MDHSVLWLVLVLCAVVATLSVAARRLRVASPILMLVAGVVLAFVPGIPTVSLDPDLVLLLLLPPLLYSSGVNMSWRGFRSNLRPILLLAIGCVVALYLTHFNLCTFISYWFTGLSLNIPTFLCR